MYIHFSLQAKPAEFHKSHDSIYASVLLGGSLLSYFAVWLIFKLQDSIYELD